MLILGQVSIRKGYNCFVGGHTIGEITPKKGPMWVNLSDTFVVILISTLYSNKQENEVITPEKNN